MRRLLAWLVRAFTDPFVVAVLLFTITVVVATSVIGDRLAALERCTQTERLVIERPEERTSRVYIDGCAP